jgi:hypothetical protein
MATRALSVSLALAALAVVAGLLAMSPHPARAALAPEDLSGPLTPDDLATQLVGEGVTVSNVTYTGADVAAGQFTGGTGIIGFESGIMLSSGDIADTVGPNSFDDTGVDNLQPGDADLTTLAGVQTFDAAVLEFDFVPTADAVTFNYVFASEEYNEFVHSEFNDVFAFFVNGTNCATVGAGQPVSINTINNGNPFDTDPRENPTLYINNDLDDGGGSLDTELDGLTVVLTCMAPVNAGATNHMKLAIADASDEVYDAVVFLETGSLQAQTPTPSPSPSPGPTAEPTAAPTASPTPAAPAQLPGTGGTSGGRDLTAIWVALAALTIASLSVAGLQFASARITKKR